MSRSDRQRIEQLREEINRHNFLYHVEARPQISDREFDGLLRELIALEEKHPELRTDDSPTQRIGGEPIDGFATVEHSVRMMSIDNTYNESELRAFDERVRKGLDGAKPRYVLEPKVDGVAVSLRYEGSKLTVAATRGDGRRGDDITANAKTVRAIPLVLRSDRAAGSHPRILEVRGEIYMDNVTFQKINLAQQAAGEEAFANPRNFTAGTLKQLDPKVTASRNLRFVAHGHGLIEPPLKGDSYFDLLRQLKGWGLPIGEHVTVANDVESAIAAIEKFAQIRGTLAYQTDGMVVKVDSFAQRRQLGETSKAPRWVIAYKYPAERAQTVLENVDWQVGKGGTLTPVARLKPVFVAGTTVSNASLHNIEQIQERDIHIGDTVVIEKAGEIIPQVVQVVPEKRPKGAKKVVAPKKCPSCGAAVEKEADSPFIRCHNAACLAQLRERLGAYVARSHMYVEGIGERIIDQLVATGKLNTFADLYKLERYDIANLESESERDGKVIKRRVGDLVATKIVQNIASTRELGLDRLLAALSIPHVGTTVGADLARWAGSLDRLLAASEDDILVGLAGTDSPLKLKARLHTKARALFNAARGVTGELFDRRRTLDQDAPSASFLADRVKAKPQREALLKRYRTMGELRAASSEELFNTMYQQGQIARSIASFFHSPSGNQIVKALQSVGINPVAAKPSKRADLPLIGLSVVVTGSLEHFSRHEIEELIVSLGGRATGSVSKSTSFVLAGADAGSKLEKANKLGVAVIDEGEFLKRVGMHVPNKS